jgi:uncharacterized protein YbjQ (UPF0145 family)
LKKGDLQACKNIHSFVDMSGDKELIKLVSTWEKLATEAKERQERAEIEAREKKERAEREARENKERAAIAAEKEKEMQIELPKILISSGFNFDGYKIVKYSGYISGDDAVQIPRSGIFGNDNGKNLTDALVKIRINALKELKEAAYALGCNAIIGVDFDYLTLEPESVNIAGGTRYEPYVICVTANGNAVIIEKE